MKQPPHNACSIADATVTVNDLPADRHGPWWRHAFEVDNAASAAYTQAVITAVQSNIFTSATGHVFVAKTPEQFTYDHDGNLTQDGRFTYAWDGENRLISATTRIDLPASVPRVRMTHWYDHQSRRIATERETWAGSAWQPAGTNRYVYDGWNVVAETRSASPANTNLYVWGLDLSGTLQGAGGIGGLLTVRKRLEDGTGIVRNYDYLFDANGNVVQEILRTDGSINAHYEYDPFGTAVIALRVDATDNPFRFSTKWFDNDTGLGYWGYRWYSPGMGRWLSRDPIGENGGKRLCSFVGNSPVSFFDVLGLFKYELVASNGVEQSNGAIGGPAHGRVQPFPSISKIIGTLQADGCKCCIDEIEFQFKQVKYLPLVGDTLLNYHDVPQPDGTIIINDPYEFQITQEQLAKLSIHESGHVWANMKIAYALFPKGESECQGKCWSKSSGTYTQQECDSLVRGQAQQVVSFFTACQIAAGIHLHKLIGTGSVDNPMPTQGQLQQYITNIKASITKWKSEKTFCSGGM